MNAPWYVVLIYFGPIILTLLGLLIYTMINDSK